MSSDSHNQFEGRDYAGDVESDNSSSSSSSMSVDIPRGVEVIKEKPSTLKAFTPSGKV